MTRISSGVLEILPTSQVFPSFETVKNKIYVLHSAIRTSENLWQTVRTQAVAVHCH